MKFFDKIRWHKPDKKTGGGYKKTNDGKVEFEKKEQENGVETTEDKNYEIEEHTKIFAGVDFDDSITYYENVYDISIVALELDANSTKVQKVNDMTNNSNTAITVMTGTQLEFSAPAGSTLGTLKLDDTGTEHVITSVSNSYTDTATAKTLTIKTEEESKTYEVSVQTSGHNYTFNPYTSTPLPSDKFPSGNNPNITINDGDTIVFHIQVDSIHPFNLDAGSTTIINGATSGEYTVTFVEGTTYTYICSNHPGMNGQIIVNTKSFSDIFTINVINENVNPYSMRFFDTITGENEITDDISNASFFKKGKTYIFEKITTINDGNLSFASYNKRFANIFITDNSSNTFNDNGDHSIITPFMFPNKDIIKTKGLNLPNADINVGAGTLIPDRIKFHIPMDYNGNHLKLVYYEDGNATSETQFDSPPKYTETINLFYVETDNTVTIMPVEKPKPIKLDWYSEIKPEADGTEIENNDKLRWKYKLEGENDWKIWTGLGANRNKFNDEDFDAIKNESGKRIKKLQLVGLDENNDETVQKQDFFIKKDLEGKKEDIHETIRHVDGNVNIKKMDLQGRLREKKLIGGTKDDIDKEKIEYMRAMVEQEKWKESDKDTLTIKSKDMLEKIDEGNFTKLKDKDLHFRKPMNDDNFDIPMISGDYKNIETLSNVEVKDKNMFYPLVQPGDYIWFDLNVSGQEDISKNKIKFQVNEDDYDKIDFCTYDNSNILIMTPHSKGDIVSYTSLGVSAEVYKFLIHGVTYLGNENNITSGVIKNYSKINEFSQLKIKKIDKDGNESDISNDKDLGFQLEKGDKLKFYDTGDNSANFDLRIKFNNKYKPNDPSNIILKDINEFVFDKEYLKIDSLELIDASGNGKKANLKTSFSKIRRKNDYSSVNKSDNKYDKYITDNENIIFEVDDQYRGKMKQIKYKKKDDVNEYTYNLTDSSGVSEFNINDIDFFNNIELTKIKFIDDNNDDIELYVRENLDRFKDRLKRDISDNDASGTKINNIHTIIDASYATGDTTSKTNNKDIKKLLRIFVDDSMFKESDNIELEANKIFKDTSDTGDFKFLNGKNLRIKKIFNDNSLNHPVRGTNTEKLDKSETMNKYFPLTHPGDYVWFDLSENVTDACSNLVRFSVNENNYEKIDIYKPFFNSTVTVDTGSIFTYIHPETDNTFNFLTGSVTYVNDPVNNIVVDSGVQQLDVYGSTYNLYLNSIKLTSNGQFEYLSLYDHTNSVVGGERIVKYDYIDYEINKGITTFKKDVSDNIIVNASGGIYNFNNVDISINKHVLKQGVYSMKVPMNHPIAIKTNKPKILCLHGGGQTAATFETLMSNIVTSLSNFEFVFAAAQSNNNVWYEDPPGGKDVGTDDVTWADESVKYLDYLVHGEKYYGLIAYSQGVPMSIVYLAKTSNIFEKVILFNGYLPTTHRGLMDVIDMSFSTKTLSVLASNDTSFYDLGLDLSSGYFTEFQQVVSSTAGHNIPDSTDPIYQTVIDFMNYTEPFHNDKINISQKYDTILITANDGASNVPNFNLINHDANYNIGDLTTLEFKKNMTYNFNGLNLNTDISFIINQKYKETPEPYSIEFTNLGNSSYLINGHHQDVINKTIQPLAIDDGVDETINIIIGDTINITQNATSHPLNISKNGTVIISSLTGQQTWTPTEVGTYTYVCIHHSDMTGSIIVHENNYDTIETLTKTDGATQYSVSITIPEKILSLKYYTSEITEKQLTVVDHLSKDGYFYYYGDISLTVLGDFHKLDVECKYHGAMGGTNALHYDYLTDFSAITQTTIINSVNNTITLNNDLITTRNYYLPYDQLTTYDINNYNIFENNTQSHLAFLNADIPSVVYSDGENIEEFLDIQDGGLILSDGNNITIDTGSTDNSFNIEYGDIITFENSNGIDAYVTLQSTTDSTTTSSNITIFTFDDQESNVSYVNFVDSDNISVRGNLIWDFSFIKINDSRVIDENTEKYSNFATYRDIISMRNRNDVLTRIDNIQYKLINEPSFVEWSASNRNSLNLTLLSNLNINKLKIIGKNGTEIEMFIYKKYQNVYTNTINVMRTQYIENDLRVSLLGINSDNIPYVRNERKNLIREFVFSDKALSNQLSTFSYPADILYKNFIDENDIYNQLQSRSIYIQPVFNDYHESNAFDSNTPSTGNTIDISAKFNDNIYFPLTQPGDYVWLKFGDGSSNIVKFMINDNNYDKVDIYEFSNNVYTKTQTYDDDSEITVNIGNTGSRNFIISSLVYLGNPYSDQSAPTIMRYDVYHTSSNILRMTFSEPIQDTTADIILNNFQYFSAEYNSTPLILSAPTINGNIMTIKMNKFLSANDVIGTGDAIVGVVFNYSGDNTNGDIMDLNGNKMISSDTLNTGIDTTIKRPILVNAVIRNESPNIFELEFDEPLDETYQGYDGLKNKITIKEYANVDTLLGYVTIQNVTINNTKVFIYIDKDVIANEKYWFTKYQSDGNVFDETLGGIVSIYHKSEIEDVGMGDEIKFTNLVIDPGDTDPPTTLNDKGNIYNDAKNTIIIDFDKEILINNNYKPPFEAFDISNSIKTYTVSDITTLGNRLSLIMDSDFDHTDDGIKVYYNFENTTINKQTDIYRITNANGLGKIDNFAVDVTTNLQAPPDNDPPEILSANVFHSNKDIINIVFNEPLYINNNTIDIQSQFRLYKAVGNSDISGLAWELFDDISGMSFANSDDSLTGNEADSINIQLKNKLTYGDIIALDYVHGSNITDNLRDDEDNKLPQQNKLQIINLIHSGENYVFDLESMSVDVSFASMLGAYFDISSQQILAQIDSIDANSYDATINLTIDIRDIQDVFLFTPDNSYACDPSAWMAWSGKPIDIFGNTMASNGLKSCVDGDNIPYRSRQTGGGEYVRHLSSQITGGYGALDIFGNETQLLNAVYDLSTQVHENIKNILSNPSSGTRENPVSLELTAGDTITTETKKVLSYTFVSQMLLSNNPRIQQLVQAHSQQEYNNGATESILSKYGMLAATTMNHMFSVPFESGDSIQFRVTVKTDKSGDNYLSWMQLTPYEIEDRSYRINLTLL